MSEVDSGGPGRGTDRFVAAMRRAVTELRRFGLDAALGSMPVRLLRRRLFRIRRDELERVMGVLGAAGIRSWLAGGWGVDALLGLETRPHSDIDLCVRAVDAPAAVDALRGLGYRITAEREAGGPCFPVRSVLRDARGRTIDLLLTGVPGDAETDSVTGLDLRTLGDDDITVGRIGDVALPCLSLALQVESHQGYPPARRDRIDMARLGDAFDIVVPAEFLRRPVLGRVTTPVRSIVFDRILVGVKKTAAPVLRLRTSSALFVPVPEADPLLRELESADIGLPPHVTVLYPFLKPRSIGDRELDELREIFAAQPSQTVKFDHFNTFEPDFGSASDSSLYLAPADPSPFIALTGAVADRWPDHLPYGGKHARVVPHLSIHAAGLDLGEATRRADRFLPLRHELDVVELAVRDRWGRWSTRARFDLGGRREQG